MMHNRLILLFGLLLPFHLGIAQSRPLREPDMMIDSSKQRFTIFKLPAYTLVNQVSWRDSVYRFSEFDYGRITLVTGFSPEEKVRLNYNLYMGHVDMITTAGDTTQIRRLKDLKLITIGDHLFYHDYKVGYIEIIHKLPVSLGVLNLMITADSDERSTTSRYDRYYMKKAYYYFLDKDNKLHKATKLSIRKLFHDQQKKVRGYLEENKPDFENQGDLIKLLTFCDDLTDEAMN